MGLSVKFVNPLAPVSGGCFSNFNKVLTTKNRFMQKKIIIINWSQRVLTGETGQVRVIH